MKIKRYTAVSMRAALAQVRAEQGADAVILSSRRSEEGIEVVAAVDYDEALFVAAARQRTPAADAATALDAAKEPQSAAAVLETVRAPEPAPRRAVPQQYGLTPRERHRYPSRPPQRARTWATLPCNRNYAT